MRLRSLLMVLLAVTGLLSSAPVAVATNTGRVTITAQKNQGTGATPRAKVEFTLGLVPGIDPNTVEGRDGVKKLQDALAKGSPAVVDLRTFTATGDDGRTNLGDLPSGVYVVHQTGIRGPAGELLADTEPYADAIIAIPTMDDKGVLWWDLDVMPKPYVAQAPTPTPAPAPTTTPTPSATSTSTVTPSPSIPQPQIPETTPVPPATSDPQPPLPQTPGINSGGGTDFDAARQWLLVMAGIALVAVAFGLTRARRDEA